MSDECELCLTPVLIQTLERANQHIARLRKDLAIQRKIAADAVSERYALQEQLMLERTRAKESK